MSYCIINGNEKAHEFICVDCRSVIGYENADRIAWSIVDDMGLTHKKYAVQCPVCGWKNIVTDIVEDGCFD